VSQKQREDAQRLRRKYARLFSLPIDEVHITYLEDEDAEIWSAGCSIKWHLLVTSPRWGDREP